jgi:hypothetical protein
MSPETYVWIRFGFWSFACTMAGLQFYTQVENGNKSATVAWAVALLTLLMYGAPEK